MKRIVLWTLSTVSCLVLLFSYHTSTSSTVATSAPSSYEARISTSSSSSGSATTGGSTSTKTKTVTGSVASTQWGPVQVRLTISGTTITQVSLVQYPNGNGRDAEINGYALPILTQETITSQNARIDMVSGATVTSVGYLQSLQSALDKAGL
jgi:uncharacterized protein with FMN-binding domain